MEREREKREKWEEREKREVERERSRKREEIIISAKIVVQVMQKRKWKATIFALILHYK